MSAMAELHARFAKALDSIDSLEKGVFHHSDNDGDSERLREVLAALQEAIDFIEQYSDVVDGPDGPEANEAMSLATQLKMTLRGGY